MEESEFSFLLFNTVGAEEQEKLMKYELKMKKSTENSSFVPECLLC